MSSSSVYNAVKELSSAPCLIALDRDGTLVPYTSRPEEAQVTQDLRDTVYGLAEQPGCNVAIVSARSVAQLRADFDCSRLILAGNYGLEVMFPDGELFVHPRALDSVAIMKEVRDELFVSMDHRNGAILEDHGYSLCLHWHRVPLAFREQLHAAVVSVADRYPQMQFRTLPTSYEVLPDFHWDKGMAVAAIDRKLRSESGDEWWHHNDSENGDVEDAGLPRAYFFAGDSHADTPAFIWINQRNGISVRVGEPELLGARFAVNEPADLHKLLNYFRRSLEEAETRVVEPSYI